MSVPERPTDDRAQRILERMASGLKIGLTVTIYFSICVIIILVIIGARP